MHVKDIMARVHSLPDIFKNHLYYISMGSGIMKLQICFVNHWVQLKAGYISHAKTLKSEIEKF